VGKFFEFNRQVTDFLTAAMAISPVENFVENRAPKNHQLNQSIVCYIWTLCCDLKNILYFNELL
jgi:hypothetical protein